jgi:hypothetical protein
MFAGVRQLADSPQHDCTRATSRTGEKSFALLPNRKIILKKKNILPQIFTGEKFFAHTKITINSQFRHLQNQ